MIYRIVFKRIIDLTFSTIGFVLLSPVFLFVTVYLFFSNNGKPFFIQKRPGKKDAIFNVIKFKTMNDKKDVHGDLLSDEERLTKVGQFMRKTSLDEVPQLLNVMKGDMSLIGPRPLLVEYLSLYNKKHLSRHDVRPGITGWAQVNGRNAISWKQKFDFDVWYVKNMSFSLDLKIIFLTMFKVMKSDGISSDNSIKMEKFSGKL